MFLKKKFAFVQIAFLLFFFIFLNFSCKKGVLTSDSFSVSAGSLEYLLFSTDYKIKTEQLLERLKVDIAKRELAIELGMLKSKAFPKYYFETKTANYRKVSRIYLKKIKENSILSYFSFQIDNKVFENISKIILMYGNKKELRNKISLLDIGKWKDKSGKKILKIKRIFSLMREGEIRELLSFSPRGIKKRMSAYIKRFFYYTLDNKIKNYFKADRSQLKKLLQAQVADLFLSVKYDMAGDGIYPTGRIKIKFTPKELYNHFYKMKSKFLKIESVNYSIAYFQKLTQAKLFINELKSVSFDKLLKKFLLVKGKKSGTFTIKGNQGLSLAQIQKRPASENLVLNMANRKEYKPRFYKFNNNIIVIRINKIEWEKKNLKFQKYKNAVAIHLNKTLLARQYKIDLADKIKDLDFKINLGKNFTIKKKLPEL